MERYSSQPTQSQTPLKDGKRLKMKLQGYGTLKQFHDSGHL